MSSILQPWVESIGLRQQGVLMSAVRGCDTAPRHDPSKIIQRILRGAILIPHAGRFANPATYIFREPDEQKWWEAAIPFLESWDHYPNHYVMHFIHAAEIIGYYGPNEFPAFSERWLKLYYTACRKLHMNPESKEQLDDRLNADEQLFKIRQTLMTHPDHTDLCVKRVIPEFHEREEERSF